MSTRMIVLLAQDSGSEVNEFDHIHDAERFIEGILAAGFERQSIRVLEAHDLDLQIIEKPVVSLLPADGASRAPAETVAAFDSRTNGDLVPVRTNEGREPYTRNGIRFSSAFVSESLGQRSDRTRRRYGPFAPSAASP